MVADAALAVKGWNAYRLRPKAVASWIVSRSENVRFRTLSLRHFAVFRDTSLGFDRLRTKRP